VGETRSFEAVDLWKYVDGDAERYLRFGVRRTLTANYRYGETVEAVADIHLMEAPRGAASIFESESPTGSRPVALADAGRSYGQVPPRSFLRTPGGLPGYAADGAGAIEPGSSHRGKAGAAMTGGVLRHRK
jgi:hypothetical protein